MIGAKVRENERLQAQIDALERELTHKVEIITLLADENARLRAQQDARAGT